MSSKAVSISRNRYHLAGEGVGRVSSCLTSWCAPRRQHVPYVFCPPMTAHTLFKLVGSRGGEVLLLSLDTEI